MPRPFYHVGGASRVLIAKLCIALKSISRLHRYTQLQRMYHPMNNSRAKHKKELVSVYGSPDLLDVGCASCILISYNEKRGLIILFVEHVPSNSQNSKNIEKPETISPRA